MRLQLRTIRCNLQSLKIVYKFFSLLARLKFQGGASTTHHARASTLPKESAHNVFRMNNTNRKQYKNNRENCIQIFQPCLETNAECRHAEPIAG